MVEPCLEQRLPFTEKLEDKLEPKSKRIVNAKSRRRRSLRSRSKNNLSLKILHTNIRGYNSKRISLETIVNSKEVDIVTINETHLKGKKKAELSGFEPFCRN